MESFFTNLFQLQENAKKQFGEKHGEILFEYLLNTIHFKLKTKKKLHELDLLIQIPFLNLLKFFFSQKTKKIYQIMNYLSSIK